MRSSILRRLLLVVVTIVAGGLVSATLVRCAPGFGADERQLDTRLSSGTIQAIQNAHADERNIVGFFFASVCKTLRGDFGVSRSLNRPVRQLLQERAGVTAALAGKGLALHGRQRWSWCLQLGSCAHARWGSRSHSSVERCSACRLACLHFWPSS